MEFISLEDKRLKDIGNFTAIDNFVIENNRLSVGSRMLYCILARYYNEEKKYSYPTKERLGYLMGCTEKTIYNYIKELETEGLIKVKQFTNKEGKYRNNIYKVLAYKEKPDYTKYLPKEF